ncbi:MAG: hypothetical protein ACRDXX_05050 [Stackebrandtia sp.]
MAVAFGAAALFATGGSAVAEGDKGEIVFSGGCGLVGIGNSSKPDKSEMTVEEGAEVTFVNNLGSDATLHLGGDKKSVASGKEYTTKMTKSVEALMAPGCMADLLKDVKTTDLTVEPASSGGGGGNSGGGNGSGGGSGDGGGNGSGGDSGDGGGNGSGGDSGGGDVGVPDDGQNPIDEADDPAANGAVPEPDGGQEAESHGDAGDSGSAAGDGGNSGNAGDGAVEAVDAEAKASSQEGASGLLALLATVCLIGVGVAAVRSFVSRSTAAA